MSTVVAIREEYMTMSDSECLSVLGSSIQNRVFVMISSPNECMSMYVLKGSMYDRVSTSVVILEESIGLLILKGYISVVSLEESMSMSVLEGSIWDRVVYLNGISLRQSPCQCLSSKSSI